MTEDRLQQAINTENYDTEDDTYANRQVRIQSKVSDWDGLMGARKAQTGQIYSTELTGMTPGTRVNQSNPTRDFQPANSNLLDVDPLGLSGNSNWQVAVNATFRDFEMSVRRSSLYTDDNSLSTTISDLLDWTLDGSLVFWTQFEDDSSKYRMYLVDDSKNHSVAAIVTKFDGDDEEQIGVCSASAPDPGDMITIRITDAELEGADGTVECPTLEAVNDGSQDLYYAGSDEVEGTYQLVADQRENDFRGTLVDDYDFLIDNILNLVLSDLSEEDVYADSPTQEDPYTTRVAYGISVETTYQDDRITYTRNVTYPAAAR